MGQYDGGRFAKTSKSPVEKRAWRGGMLRRSDATPCGRAAFLAPARSSGIMGVFRQPCGPHCSVPGPQLCGAGTKWNRRLSVGERTLIL
jgi:hypothetical protein